ncbi:MAG: ATP-grasp domain-containing protein, partial [Chloroflexota bacterium]|nr:ATP-grasp domain-containing protein [Chloroflexota bacterium]
GIEFDYCSVHAAWALQEEGLQSIMVNSNPETVSTDFDTSQRLYFEPLDEESVRDVIENEGGEDGDLPPAVVQFGGQTAINLSQQLDQAGLPILGSTAEAIDIASDRRRFEEFMAGIGVPQPPGTGVTTVEEALQVAETIGYPVLVRPSYVLGGRAMQIVQSPDELGAYFAAGVQASPDRPVLVDKYLEGKECEVDAVCDGETVVIPGIMEHVERAGVHSGDSMAIYPGITMTTEEVDVIVDYAVRIARGLGVRGLMNIQFVVMGGGHYRSPGDPRGTHSADVYVLEVNPRASRTIPFISKVTGVPMVQLATKVMLGRTLEELGYETGLWPRQRLVAVKAPVFSMSKLAGVDTHLGPEMKSTGEVMGVDYNYSAAMAKALIASNMALRPECGVLLSISDKDKQDAMSLISALANGGHKLYATEGTANLIRNLGFTDVVEVSKLWEGSPNVVDVVQLGMVDAVVNTLSGSEEAPMRDGFYIRRAAVERRIPCFTSLDTARTAMEAVQGGGLQYTIQRHQDYLEKAAG